MEQQHGILPNLIPTQPHVTPVGRLQPIYGRSESDNYYTSTADMGFTASVRNAYMCRARVH